MGKIIDAMNFNYYNSNQENSLLAPILLDIFKVSIHNGTYPRMAEIFKREIPTSKCFNDERHKDMDHLVNFCNTMEKAMRDIPTNDNVISEENTQSKTL